jgi:hypothetical protein
LRFCHDYPFLSLSLLAHASRPQPPWSG